MDITFAPFLERIVSSLAYYKGFRVRGEVCPLRPLRPLCALRLPLSRLRLRLPRWPALLTNRTLAGPVLSAGPLAQSRPLV